MSKKPPPGVDIDLDAADVQKAAAMIQKSFRGHRVRKKMLEDGPPKFLDDLQDVTMVEGSACRLDCRLAGFPDPTVQWFKGPEEIKEGSKYKVVFEDPDICALVIMDAKPEDVAKYTCKAYNRFGDVYQSASLSIEVPACVTSGPQNVTAKVGDTVKFTTKIGGDPEPDIGWAKGEEDIEEDDRVSFDIIDDTTVLTIRNVTKKDAGKYECYCENSLGYDHTFCRLDVK